MKSISGIILTVLLACSLNIKAFIQNSWFSKRKTKPKQNIQQQTNRNDTELFSLAEKRSINELYRQTKLATVCLTTQTYSPLWKNMCFITGQVLNCFGSVWVYMEIIWEKKKKRYVALGAGKY